MSFGCMNTLIEIVKERHSLDADGFATASPVVLATVRAYRETKHAKETQTNHTAFATATDFFRFRTIPYFTLTTDMIILCENERFEILSVEDMKNRRMYYEVLAKKVQASG